MSHKALLKRIHFYIWPKTMPNAKLYLFLSIGFLVLGRVFLLTGPVVFKHLVDEINDLNNYMPLKILALFILVRILAQLFNELRDYVFSILSQRIFREVSVRVFKHLHDLSLKFHLNRKTGALSRIIERGTNSLESISRFLMMTILPSIVESFFLFILLCAWYGIWCGLIMLVTIISYSVFTIVVSANRIKIVKEINAEDNKAQTRAIDSLLNFETVKYFTNENLEINEYDKIQANYEIISRKLKSSLNFLNLGQSIIFSIGLGAMLFVAINGAHKGEITAGDIAALFAFALQLVMPLFNLGFAYREIKQGIVNIKEMLLLLEQDSDIKDLPTAVPLVCKSGKIVFENVSFSYDDRKIIDNISLEIPAGKTAAFVGATGSGKSTLSKLLFRFYDPTKGRILIDDQDISMVTQKSLRKLLGIVPQDTVLFNDSLLYNIVYGSPAAGKQAIDDAVKRAELDEFIRIIPNGLNTVVGERGLKLSGGEKQRIAIARVLLKSPEIFIFDEATSALDINTEKLIQHNLKKISHGKTTIVIAHRLSTIVDADIIFVINNGKIAEFGTHHELLQKDGSYKQLWSQQSKSN